MFLSACRCLPIGWDSQVEGQSLDLGSGSEGAQEVVGETEGGAILQKSDSVEEGEEVEEAAPETSK